MFISKTVLFQPGERFGFLPFLRRIMAFFWYLGAAGAFAQKITVMKAFLA
jgi:hypothetical protein